LPCEAKAEAGCRLAAEAVSRINICCSATYSLGRGSFSIPCDD